MIAAARAVPPSPDDVARLAVRLADSGLRLSWQDASQVADVASTGGPGSLSTLITPLVLRTLGCRVVKLAVPGRPAGAIDSLATVPGYQARVLPDDVRGLVERTGFAHFLADDHFAPMDAALFAYRRAVGAVDVPALAAASLLSKKIAVGVVCVGLDVQVGPHGNFGRTLSEARANARFFCEAASVVGLDAVAFLSAGPTPPQPWIGRGESLLALAAAVGELEVKDQDGWLGCHVSRCYEMAKQTAALRSPCGGESIGVAARDVRTALMDHLLSQGATWEGFVRRAETTARAPREPVKAPEDGRLNIDLSLIRAELVARQGGAGVEPFRDPAGVEVLVRHGDIVRRGELLARIRCDGGRSARLPLAEAVAPAFSISQLDAADEPPLDEPLEVVRA